MYYEHFGLTQAPFKITPNTDFFFGGGNRGPILEALIYAITQGEGIVKVTGEVGSGKTMLCSMLQSRLPEQVVTVYLANPSVSPEEILHAIAFEMQLDIARDASRLVVMHAIQAYLLQRHAEGKRVVLFVEESQGMPIATLEEIRLLSNLETKSDKLLQIVLFGQPELDDNLRENRIRQLKERHALVVAENGKPMIARLIRCIDGKPGAQLLRQQEQVRSRLFEARRMVVTPEARTTAALVEAKRRGLIDEGS